MILDYIPGCGCSRGYPLPSQKIKKTSDAKGGQTGENVVYFMVIYYVFGKVPGKHPTLGRV